MKKWIRKLNTGKDVPIEDEPDEREDQD